MPFTRQQLDAEWEIVRKSPAAATALTRWRTDERLAAFEDPQEILAATAIGVDPDHSEVILRALAEQAVRCPVAARTLLQALLPGICAAARRARFHLGEDALAHATAEACVRIVGGVPARRPGRVAANVIMDVRAALMNSPGEPRNEMLVCESDVILESQPAPTPNDAPADHVIDLVTAAHEAGVISHHAARVIVATRAYGFAIEEVARSTGRAACGLRQLRRRAEAAIRHWVFESDFQCEYA